MRINTKTKGGGLGKFFLILLLTSLIGGGTYVALVFFEKEQPEINISGISEYLGASQQLKLTGKDEKSGLRNLSLSVSQDGKTFTILREEFPRQGYSGQIGPVSISREVEVNLEKLGLKDGEAEIIAVASDFSLRGLLRGNTTEVRKQVTIDTEAPKIRLLHAERYIEQGGSGIVIYQLDGEAVRHGADFAGHFHAGHPVGDGRDDVFLAYIALPYNVEKISTSTIIAEDAAGNSSGFPFSTVFKAVRHKKDRINISDNFLGKKIPEFQQYYPEMQGDLTEKYLYTNRNIRKANNQKIFELCQNPAAARLWKSKFQRMAGASRAGYADHRTYYYNGKEIDQQVHLGMDIASTQRAEVRAANRGIVVFADYLGIYGNMVLVDHGQGVFSLYSHLSSIQVQTGDEVAMETVLGLTGTSGMAGGDHLHFSMLINGIFVTPKEWWDEQWINVTIEDPLANSKF